MHLVSTKFVREQLVNGEAWRGTAESSIWISIAMIRNATSHRIGYEPTNTPFYLYTYLYFILALVLYLVLLLNYD